MKLSHVIVAIVFFILGAVCAVGLAAQKDRGTSWWTFGATSTGKTFHYEDHVGAAPPVAVRFKFEPGINRQGADYSDFNLAKGAKFSACELACESDKTCKAYTFVKAGPRGALPHCWLKNAVPMAYKDDQCITGVKE